MEQRSGRSVSEIKKFYEGLLNSGELEEIYPKAIGSWKDDKKDFIKYYIETIELENEIEEDHLENFETFHQRNFKDELGLDED